MANKQTSLFEMKELFTRDDIATMTNESWIDFLYPILNSSYMESVAHRLYNMEKRKEVYYPAKKNIFRAFKLVDYHKLKAVIIGQDPYHGPNQATGLAFAIPNDQKKVPPSLRIIKKKIIGGIENDLEYIAKQNVLLLNTALTVKAGSPGSHLSLWKPIIDLILKKLSETPRPIEWIMWGLKAQAFRSYVNEEKDKVFISYHPAAEARGSAKFELPIESSIQWTKTKLNNTTKELETPS